MTEEQDPAALPEIALPPLAPHQRRALLDEAHECLSRTVILERLLKEQGQAEGPVYELIRQGRLDLAAGIHDTTAALATAPSAEVAPPPPAAITDAHRALGPFQHTLGPVPGGMTMGKEVSDLQQLLRLEGFQAPEHGRYDSHTVQAVAKFQQQQGLRKPDGIVGVDTRRLLNHLTGREHVLPERTQINCRLADNAQRTFNRLLGRG